MKKSFAFGEAVGLTPFGPRAPRSGREPPVRAASPPFGPRAPARRGETAGPTPPSGMLPEEHWDRVREGEAAFACSSLATSRMPGRENRRMSTEHSSIPLPAFQKPSLQ
jgi:hypothetical protein